MALPSQLTTFSFSHSDQIDALYTIYSASQIKTKFDSRAEELRVKLNAILTALASTLDGDSGADNVGATPISGLTGATVQALIESLKALVDLKATTTTVYTKTEINATTSGSSGTELLGARAISGVTGATAYEQLSDLKTQLSGVVLGSIPDGSLTIDKFQEPTAGSVKLSNYINTIGGL